MRTCGGLGKTGMQVLRGTSIAASEPMNWLAQLEVVGVAAVAAVLGALVGAEREARRKAAGLRTHATVACAAALFVALGDVLMDRFAMDNGASQVASDPIRVVEAIVTGVSFIGAGSMIVRRDRQQVEGLTTAAALLLTASVGVAVGLRQFVLAVGVTVLTLLVLGVVGAVQARVSRAGKEGPDDS